MINSLLGGGRVSLEFVVLARLLVGGQTSLKFVMVANVLLSGQTSLTFVVVALIWRTDYILVCYGSHAVYCVVNRLLYILLW